MKNSRRARRGGGGAQGQAVGSLQPPLAVAAPQEEASALRAEEEIEAADPNAPGISEEENDGTTPVWPKAWAAQQGHPRAELGHRGGPGPHGLESGRQPGRRRGEVRLP